MTASLTVQPGIFNRLPGLKILVAVIRNIDPALVEKEKISQLLHECWNSARMAVAPYPTVQSHPNIASWRKAYSSLGISVKKFTSSIENLAKRASKVDSTPRSINPIVDFYNACSLKFLLPFGAFDLDDKDIEQLELRFTKEGDQFHSLDAIEPENVPMGEASYVSGNIVVTRHINWKQSKEGLIKDSTSNAVVMAEILSDISDEQIRELQDFFQKTCDEMLKKSPDFFILTEDSPAVSY